MTWRLTRDAERDLDELVQYGATTYGAEQALVYYDLLASTFERISANPKMARERLTSRRRVRILPTKAHNVLYAIEGTDVLILRILHHSANWTDHL